MKRQDFVAVCKEFGLTYRKGFYRRSARCNVCAHMARGDMSATVSVWYGPTMFQGFKSFFFHKPEDLREGLRELFDSIAEVAV